MTISSSLLLVLTIVLADKLLTLEVQLLCMEPGSDCVVKSLVSTVAKYHMVPFEYILYDGFWKDNLPDLRLCWVKDVNNRIKGMELFMSVVIWAGLDLLLQSDVLGLMIDDIDHCYRIC